MVIVLVIKMVMVLVKLMALIKVMQLVDNKVIKAVIEMGMMLDLMTVGSRC